jgi:hypothetical protein
MSARCRPDIQGESCQLDLRDDEWQACDRVAGQPDSGYYCLDGVCQAGCRRKSDCGTGETCIGYFLELGRGLCEAPCDPFGANTCPDGLSCSQIATNLFTSTIEPWCAPTGDGVEADECTLDEATLGHDCSPGLVCGEVQRDRLQCARLCRTADDCAQGQSCNPWDIRQPDALGICEPLRAPPRICVPNPCTEPNRAVCTEDGGAAICSCNPGFADDDGTCRDEEPCEPNPCREPNRAVCRASGFEHTCACDPGFVEEGDTCRDESPCDPNPCIEENRTVCTPSGFTHTCSCNAGTLGENCLTPCAGNTQHFDGDALEPNECAEQATPLAPTPAGEVLALTAANIGPLASDVDYFRVSAPSGHVHWILLAADAPLCSGISATVAPSVSPLYRYAREVTGTHTFSCASGTGSAANPSYQLSVLDFALDSADYSNSSTSPTELPATQRWAANTLDENGDQDSFSFDARAPFSIREVGRRLFVSVTLTNPANGELVSTTTATCGEGSTLADCIRVDGSGLVRTKLTITPAPEDATSGLSAYRFEW